MKQIRWITHNDDHVDEETLFGDIWAVTRCDCKLTNAALLPDTKEIDMYNGWIEPKSTQDYRTMQRALTQDARNLYLRQTSEEDADALHDCIFAAEIADAKIEQKTREETYFEWTCQACGMRLPSTEKGCPNCGGRGEHEQQFEEAADILQAWGEFSQPVRLVHNYDERTISLDEWWNKKYSSAPYSAQPPAYVKGQGFTGG